jgi:hypothetical protein
VSVIAWPATEDDIDRSAESMIAAWRQTNARDDRRDAAAIG